MTYLLTTGMTETGQEPLIRARWLNVAGAATFR
jgi:hypothetical protein